MSESLWVEPRFYPHNPLRWEWLDWGDPVPCGMCSTPTAQGWYQVSSDQWACRHCKRAWKVPTRKGSDR